MKELSQFFNANGASAELSELLVSLADAGREIAGIIPVTATGKAGSMNSFGEEQIKLDVRAEEIVSEHLRACEFVCGYGSEELSEYVKIRDEGFSVFYDPLDGSSLVDVNFAFGTIFGIYEGGKFVGRSGREQIAAMYLIYGPRTTLVFTIQNGVHEFILQDGEWKIANENLQISEAKYFAPGNLRAAQEREDYLKFVNEFIREKYTLRYSGGMVPDINHILKKGGGIFMYPGMPSAPNGKLRLLYECAPMAFIVEHAGGRSSNGKINILDVKIEGLEQRTAIFIGSKGEVKKCEESL